MWRRLCVHKIQPQRKPFHPVVHIAICVVSFGALVFGVSEAEERKLKFNPDVYENWDRFSESVLHRSKEYADAYNNVVDQTAVVQTVGIAAAATVVGTGGV